MVKTMRLGFLWAGLTAVWLLVAGIGCQPMPVQEPPLVFSAGTAGTSVENREIAYEVWGTGPETVLVMAGIHGDEQAGVRLCEEFSKQLRAGKTYVYGVQLVLVKAVNPDGIAQNRRENNAGVDLNRNFPGSNRDNNLKCGMEALSEPESKAVDYLLTKFKPARVISIHEPFECLDYDGAGKPIAEAMACCCDLPVKKLGLLPGSLGTYVSEGLGTPIVTMELSKKAATWQGPYLWIKYGQSLLSGIEYKKY